MSNKFYFSQDKSKISFEHEGTEVTDEALSEGWTIQEIREYKKSLEEEILNLLRAFSRKTSVNIEDVELIFPMNPMNREPSKEVGRVEIKTRSL